jgi:hypothetical protein
LDASSPPPSPDLLSAEEAKEKLRELIEGLFFRRLKGEEGNLLVKSPPGRSSGRRLEG